MTDHDGDEVRELEEEAHALLDRLSHGDPNHRRLAARAREVLEQSPSPVHLQAVIAALKSAVNEMASYFRRKAEQGCPPARPTLGQGGAAGGRPERAKPGAAGGDSRAVALRG